MGKKKLVYDEVLCNKLIAAISLRIRKGRYNKGVDARDVFQDICAYQPNITTEEEFLSYADDCIRISFTTELNMGMGEEELTGRKHFSFWWLKNKLASDPEYLLKHLKRNSLWERIERLNNIIFRTKRNSKKREVTATHTIRRNSEDKIRCPLHSGKCFRMALNKMNNHNCCPLPNKFLLKDKFCNPIKNRDSKPIC